MTNTITSSTIDHVAALELALRRLDFEICATRHKIKRLQDELDDLERARSDLLDDLETVRSDLLDELEKAEG